MKDTNPRNSRANVTVVLLNVMHANDPVALNTDIKEKKRKGEKEERNERENEGEEKREEKRERSKLLR